MPGHPATRPNGNPEIDKRVPVIAVCGEALMDLVGNGAQAAHPGGGPFNTARALARLGVPSTFIGRFSDDPFGVELRACLAAEGVDLSMAAVGPEPTTVALAELDDAGIASYRFRVSGTSAPNLTADMIPARLPADVRALHVGSLGLLLQPMATTIAGLVNREASGRVVIVDPNIRATMIRDEQAYRRRLEAVMARSTIVKASLSDITWLQPGTSVEEAATSALRHPETRLVVVTLGASGAFGATAGAQVHVDAPRVAMVDTIGAGDAFGAALLTWLYDHELLIKDLVLDESRLKAALTFACLVASTSFARSGAATPRRN